MGGGFWAGLSGSWLPEGHDEAAEDDEGSSGVDGAGGGLVELEAGDELGDKEEENDVDAEELAEVDAGGVEKEGVGDEDEGSCEEPDEAARAGGVVKAGLEAGVALDFEIGGEGEDEEGADGIGDELGEGVHGWPRRGVWVDVFWVW